jgi:Mrp family chromosome partitioning ATPase/capsular polysaccharide biosynthesis protein
MTQSPATDTQLNLRHYLRVLRRRKWVIIGSTVLVTVLTLMFSLREAKVYQSTAQVLLNRQDLSSTLTGTQNPSLTEDPARYSATQATLARSRTVASLAVARAGVPHVSPGTLLGNSSVTPNPNADVLVFTVQGPDPASATALANAYANAYAETGLKLDSAALQSARNELNGRIAALRSSSPQDTALIRSLVSKEQELHTMQLLQSAGNVLPATGSGAQIKPTPRRDALLGFGFGLIIGVAAAFLLEALDTKIRSESEIERELGLPLLARLPEPRRLRGNKLTMIGAPTSAEADAVRRLATTIEFSNPDHPAQTLLVTGAMQGEGKSTTAANLAVALARSGRSVVVVDLDLRQPSIASLFDLHRFNRTAAGLHRFTGLTNVVMGQATLENALVSIQLAKNELQPSGQEGTGAASPDGMSAASGRLSVLPTGPLPANPGEFAAAKAVATRVLEPLREMFDYVIIDTPPMSIGGDVVMLSGRVDSLILVARLGVINRAALTDLKRQLATMPSPALGFVLTGVGGATPYYGPYSPNGGEPRSELTPPVEEDSVTGTRRVRS